VFLLKLYAKISIPLTLNIKAIYFYAYVFSIYEVISTTGKEYNEITVNKGKEICDWMATFSLAEIN
jgi:hypothetical protein